MQWIGYYTPAESDVDELLLFEGASRESIEVALRRSRVYRAARGEVVLAPHVRNTTVYVVLSGALRVDVVDRGSREHSHVKRGECVGELSVIDGGATSATVVAVDDCELLALPGETVLELVECSHAVARNLVRLLTQRLKGSNRLLRHEAESSEILRHQVSFDALTGLHSRAWLDATLPRLCNRVRHGGERFALAVCDLDFFKNINDTFGHLTGDRVLQKVSAVLTTSLRPTDFAARFGGEELVAILCGVTEVHDALSAVERIRRAVRSLEIEGVPPGPTPAVTVSIGVAVYDRAESSEQLIRRADAALYLAKRGGRDRVEAHTLPPAIAR
jgi:diguanylate cyclase (GGDEF)-like protein